MKLEKYYRFASFFISMKSTIISLVILIFSQFVFANNFAHDNNLFAISGTDSDAQGNVYFINDDDNNIYKADIHGQVVKYLTVDFKSDSNFEGLSLGAENSFWIVSEGRPKKRQDNVLLHIDKNGRVLNTVKLPYAISKYANKYGFEGVAFDSLNQIVWVAQQRAWQGLNKQLENNTPVIGLFAFSITGDYLGKLNYALDAAVKNENNGVSDLSYDNGVLYVLERDNKKGKKAQNKKIYKIILDDRLSLHSNDILKKILFFDFVKYFQNRNIKTPEKIEAIIVKDNKRQFFYATDNDGKDEIDELHFNWIDY